MLLLWPKRLCVTVFAFLIASIGVPVWAQSAAAPPLRVAYFSGASLTFADTIRNRIVNELAKRGHRVSQDFTIDIYSIEGNKDRLAEVADKIVKASPDFVYAGSWDAANAMRRVTKTIPVVFSAWANLESPNFRIVDNLSRPEGNLTGFTSYTNLIPKKLQLLKEAFPSVERIGFVHGVEIRPERKEEYSAAAQRLGIQLSYRLLTNSDISDITAKIDALPDEALLIAHDDWLIYNRIALLPRFAASRKPLIYPEKGADSGVLMHYVAEVQVEAKVAEYLSKLFKGAKVRDLAVQEPQEFDFSVNMTTLRRNGLTMSRDVLARARKVE